MKKLAITIILLIITVMQCMASSKPTHSYSTSDPQNARAAQKYLATHTSYGKITVGEWQKMSPSMQGFIVSGIYIGIATAMFALDPDTTPEVRAKRSYLLEGWNRPAKDYAKEIDQAMKRQNPNKSISEALITAQIKFTSESGQTQMAQALKVAMQRLPAYSKDSTPGGKSGANSKNSQLWHAVTAKHTEVQLTAGMLDGIALENAAMHQGCQVPGLASDPNKLAAEMRKEASHFKPTDKLINLLEYTVAKHPAQSATK